jgi:hypothetical protein
MVIAMDPDFMAALVDLGEQAMIQRPDTRDHKIGGAGPHGLFGLQEPPDQVSQPLG